MVDILYSRTEAEFKRGTFRVKGDTVDIFLAYADHAIRIYFWGDEIEAIQTIDPVMGKKLSDEKSITVFPGNLFVTGKDALQRTIHEIQDDLVQQIHMFEAEKRHLEAKRIKERTEFDIEMMRELGAGDIPVIGVAKGPDRDAGREHFHRPGSAQPVMLEPRDPVLYFVQRLRDEAHRFAIGSHRAKRSKAISANPLDEIEGIGPTRKRALLKHFGSAKSVSKAGISDLAAVDGVSEAMAQKIYDFFHDRRG